MNRDWSGVFFRSDWIITELQPEEIMMFSNKKPETPQNREQPKVTASAPAPEAGKEVPRLEAVQARIGSTVRIEGEITGKENLQIDGTVKGTVMFEQHRVVISEHGLVEGQLTADVIEVFGKCKGEIQGRSQVTVYETGDVEGDITAPRVALESGARFKGSVDMAEEHKGGVKKQNGAPTAKKDGDDKTNLKSSDDVYGLNHVS